MSLHCSAYGVTLELGVPLPELAWAPPGGESPLVVQAGDDGWSGPAGPRSERRVDGARFTVEQGTAGDVLMTWGEAGRFHLAGDRLTVAGDFSDPAWQRVLLDSVLASAALVRGAEALHAAAVVVGGAAVAIVAGEGGGKTSLAAALVGAGGQLLADDVVVVDAQGRAHPAPPVANVALHGPVPAAALGRPLAVLGDESWVAVRDPATAAVPLRRVVILERGGGAPPAVPDVLRHMLTSGSTTERQASRFLRAADITAAAPVERLDADPAAPPDVLAAQVLDAA